jgi:hypothetical protein
LTPVERALLGFPGHCGDEAPVVPGGDCPGAPSEAPAMPFTTSNPTAVRAVPGVWVHTTLEHTPASTGGSPSFLTADQQERLERIRQARLLFDGHHRQYFLDEGRTQFDFPQVRAGGRIRPLYLTYNVLGLISLKGADLLFGQQPLLRAKDTAQQDALAELADRSNLHALFYGCAVDASYEGECFLEACAADGRSYLRQVPADEIFPLGAPLPDGQYAGYVRYRVKNAGTGSAPIWLLLQVTYLPGRIERACYQLDDKGGRREVVLSAWEDAELHGDGAETPACVRPFMPASLEPVTRTGIAANTITRIPNLVIRGRAVSDYDGAVDLQDALNAKNSQVGRVLLKHSDPRLAFPEESFGPDGSVRADHEVFAFADPSRVPKYITWDAELQHAMADRAFVLNQLLVRTETSPVLLGLKEGAAPDAYKKVRLESFNSLTKAARKAAYWRAGVRRAVGVAQDLENAVDGGPRYARGEVAVQLRDGIPSDALEDARRLAVLRGAGLISLRRAVEEQLQDPAAVEKELARLAPSDSVDSPTSP